MATSNISPEVMEQLIAHMTAQLGQQDTKVAKCVFPILELKNQKYVPTGCRENTEALFDFYGITVRYNEMTKQNEVSFPGRTFNEDTKFNSVLSEISDCARLQGYSPEVAERNLYAIASSNSYHPVRDWILSSKWDGVSRLKDLYDTIESETPIKKMLMEKWLTSCVALVMYGTDFQNEDHKIEGFRGTEGVLIFSGRQGISKTQWFESLAPRYLRFVKDGLHIDIKNKDSVMAAVSTWIGELGEIDSTFSKSDVSQLKAFVTKKADELRPPYAKAADNYLRRVAFCGSVNQHSFLNDKDGRRWWVISVTNVNKDHGINMQQVWAEVYETKYLNCVPYWLLPEEREMLRACNQQHETQSSIEQLMDAFVFDPADEIAAKRIKTKAKWYSATQLYAELTGKTETNKNVLGEIATWCRNKNLPFQKPNLYRCYVDVTSLAQQVNARQMWG